MEEGRTELQPHVRRNPKVVTLTPGKWIYVCPCGFPYRVMIMTRTCRTVGVYCFYCKREIGKYYKIMDERLEFEQNWNNKLNCNCFTTIRLHNPIKYCVDAVKNIYLDGRYKGDARILSVKPMRLDQINLFVSKLDMGLPPEECIKEIKKLYKNRPGLDWQRQQVDLILLEYIKESKEPSLFY